MAINLLRGTINHDRFQRNRCTVLQHNINIDFPFVSAPYRPCSKTQAFQCLIDGSDFKRSPSLRLNLLHLCILKDDTANHFCKMQVSQRSQQQIGA